ncbi:hypothetical protein [Streptomyces sp. NPDC085466]|uniref:hypothetical protein n=1 Tax=Streptomyces sp. NPDC085466 TaxID=3365725 RepID=UPI0037D88072
MRRLTLASAGLTMLLLTGCSIGKEESTYQYSVPERICDVTVTTPDIKPLLPPGKTIKESSMGRPGEGRSCGVIVDERVDLKVSYSRQTGELDIAREADDKYIGLERIALGGTLTSAAVGDDGAVAWMTCDPKPGQPQYEMPESKLGKYTHLVLEIRAEDWTKNPENIGEWRANTERFLRAYLAPLTEAWCR